MNAPLKTKDFYGRDFLVTSDVLVPRPETEQIIDIVKSLAGLPILPGVKPSSCALPPHPVIYDVGTGSGCIAITIKKEFKEANVYASDISEPALKVAQKNASRLKAPITFIIAHLLQKVKYMTIPTPDLVVANLPYVDETWPWVDKAALSSEPSIALYAKNHGLALIYELIDEAATLHIPYLILEADPCQHGLIQEYSMAKHYYTEKIAGYAICLKYREPKTSKRRA